MRIKLSIVLVSILFFTQGNTAQKEEIKNIQNSISKSLNVDNQLVYKHIIKSVSKDGSLVTFDDTMCCAIDWWYRSIPKKWKEGDAIYITYDFGYNQIKLRHTDSLDLAWGAIQHYPSPAPIIQSIPDEMHDPNAYSKISLNNGYVFKSFEHRQFAQGGWRIKDRVIILANSDHTYQLWNLERNMIVLSELIANKNQAVRKPIKIQNIFEMEERLNTQVLQQPEAIKAIVASLLNYTAGLNDHQRPIGVFLFIGPTGVGKTELAKTLTNEVYHNPSHLIRFDMSHFTESHSLSRFIGAQPGYVNHEEGGQLTNPLLANSQVVVLLDEVEKAHPQVRKVFLPVFDEGFILDTKNHHISCSETIFIMTSNLCAEEITQLYHLGYSSEEILAKIEPSLMEALSPELYNRVEPILFQPLRKETMETLVKLLLDKLTKNILLEKDIHIHIDDSLTHFLEKKGYHPLLGARPLKKLIEKRVVSSLAYYIIKEDIKKDDTLTLFYNEGTDTIIVKKAT